LLEADQVERLSRETIAAVREALGVAERPVHLFDYAGLALDIGRGADVTLGGVGADAHPIAGLEACLF
jgi:hypothetical protein